MDNQHTYQVYIKGLVQGVGFRPFIYGLANSFDLKGWVENRNDGVCIKINSTENMLSLFIENIQTKAPSTANVLSIDYHKVEYEEFINFSIKKSLNSSNNITQISPDIAICHNCLTDLKKQSHRIDYPFINCTNCGPRFSIIEDLPYDREKTTMRDFNMCDVCSKEYQNINDRRFHAQPIACNNCGPEYTLIINERIINNYDEILKNVSQLISNGKIIAVKGLGGFHLLCDAFNIESVKTLRYRKLRENKAFALLFSDIKSAKKYAQISEKEEEMLIGWQRPIVILPYLKIFNEYISNGLNTIGVMLPYLAFHYQLFEKIDTEAVVLTSANISDRPIIIKNKEALKELNNIADAFLIYNREIYNRCDDSVGYVVNNKPRLIRRSRGYVPNPIMIPHLNFEGILAVGAELSNCFSVGRNNDVFLSQHIGDLKNYETFNFFKESIHQFKKLFRIKPKIIVSDLHPDYLSSQWATQIADTKNLALVKVQHHHAHIAACMGENQLDEKVIGISFDGTGLGDDGKIWGGEFLICDLNDYKRINHFEYMPLPGGDKVSKQPWRMALSYLYNIYGNDYENLQLSLLQSINSKEIAIVKQMMDKKINTPLSSSAGRLFDAVAAICGICYYNTFQAEAPMRLEALIDKSVTKSYDYLMRDHISFKPMIRQIVDDMISKKDLKEIVTKFHNTIVKASVHVVINISKRESLKKVVLSGGVFQNRFLLGLIENLLHNEGFKAYSHSQIPTNDGGIAFGQMMIAAKRRKLNLT